MYRPALLTFGTIAALAAGSMLAHGRDAAPPRSATPSAAAGAGTLRMDDALATAVIGTLSQQFDTSDVTVQLGRVDVSPTSVRDRELRGTGRVRIDGDAQWIDFRFAALYDTQTAEVTHPRLHLDAAPATAKAQAGLSRSLEAKVAAALREEFSGQPVAWSHGSTKVADTQGRYVRVTGTGVADFGAEGRVDARVEGLYDRIANRWLRVNYELGEPQEFDSAGRTVASL